MGIDVGTTSVKAVAVDPSGAVVARVRVPHRVISPTPDVLEHDALRAWRHGPRRAAARLAEALDGPAAGVVTTLGAARFGGASFAHVSIFARKGVLSLPYLHDALRLRTELPSLGRRSARRRPAERASRRPLSPAEWVVGLLFFRGGAA